MKKALEFSLFFIRNHFQSVALAVVAWMLRDITNKPQYLAVLIVLLITSSEIFERLFYTPEHCANCGALLD